MSSDVLLISFVSYTFLQRCAAYFTTVLYVEHWCEESFGGLTLGEPDFSNDDGVLSIDSCVQLSNA